MPFYIVEDFNTVSSITEGVYAFDTPIVDDNGVVINEDFRKLFPDDIHEDGTLNEETAPMITGPHSLCHIRMSSLGILPLQWSDEDNAFEYQD